MNTGDEKREGMRDVWAATHFSSSWHDVLNVYAAITPNPRKANAVFLLQLLA